MVPRLPGTPKSWLDKEISKEEAEWFSRQLHDARKSGRYQFEVAAHLIAQVAGFGVSTAKIEERLILDARDGSLPVYDMGATMRWDGDIPFFATFEIYWDDLNNWLEINEKRVGHIFKNPDTFADAAQTELQTTSPHVKEGAMPMMQSETRKPWTIEDPRDPKPEQPWYTSARYFARQLASEDSTLRKKKYILAKRVVEMLTAVGIKKRGGKKPFDPGTIKKALSNVLLV